VAFAAKSDPITRKRELSLADLENIPIIVRSNGVFESATQSLLRTLKQSVQKLNIAMCCESPEAIKNAVSQKLGIGFLYYDAVKAAIERGSFKMLRIRGLEIEGRTYIVYHKERPLSPNAEEFLKLLRNWRDQQTANA
jgi:DNA-binding transcriptional LysR family regulator